MSERLLVREILRDLTYATLAAVFAVALNLVLGLVFGWAVVAACIGLPAVQRSTDSIDPDDDKRPKVVGYQVAVYQPLAVIYLLTVGWWVPATIIAVLAGLLIALHYYENFWDD